jgi:hypothetical protein
VSRARALKAWLIATDRRQQLLWCLLLYGLSMAALLVVASRSLLTEHTPYNHFALLAEGWLDGRLDMGGPPPEYARGNDFASYDGKWFVAFPPFPAVILLPLVMVAGAAEHALDGLAFLWLAGTVPCLVFLLLQRLCVLGLSQRSPLQNAALGLLSCFGTVFFFTAEQGTVWFAAHVVGVCLAALYALFALGATHPVWAGVALGLASLTRAPLLFAVPLFALEALRVSLRSSPDASTGGLIARCLGRVDWRALLGRVLLFALPVAVCLAFTLWYNWARFDHPLENGYRFLTVAWKARMEKWGLFDYHYLSRNLGVVFSMLPWSGNEQVPFRINTHGLALWFTTPLYLWTLWPRLAGPTAVNGEAAQAASWRDVRWVHTALWLTVGCVAIPTLFYQNTGWSQFGYRFSNDYMVFLFALLAVGARPLRALFIAAALWGVVVNTFGAVSFGRSKYQQYYYSDPSQTKFYERD